MKNFLLKKELSPQQLLIVRSEMATKAKSKTVAYLLWLFLGLVGGHRYYVGDFGKGIAMTFTLGGLVIWALLDVFFIGPRVEEINDDIEFGLIQAVSNPVCAAAIERN